ncbi:MAG: agmatine deiminase family protein [Microscillaceae bacterium]|nr:agmatine deiminase family protein [Microscillaceae bacterium]
MRSFLGIFLLLSWGIALKAQSDAYRFPAEWEEQQGVILSWDGELLRDTTTCRIVEALHQEIDVYLLIKHDSLLYKVKNKLSEYQIDVNRVKFIDSSPAFFWMRDPGPLFLKNNRGEQAVACFQWSDYGIYNGVFSKQIMSQDDTLDGLTDEYFADYFKLPKIKSDIRFEGGAIDVNSTGTMLGIKDMALQRNPGKSLAEIELELKRVLGLKKIIWLSEGLIEDKYFPDLGPMVLNYFSWGANMHVDEFCRFVNDTTVLFLKMSKEESKESPVNALNYPIIEKNYKILQKARTAEGKKLTIYRVPLPNFDLIVRTIQVDEKNVEFYGKFGHKVGDSVFDVPASSYLNFLISNESVLVAKYWKPGMPESQKQKDTEVLELLQKLFPTRKIIQINPYGVNFGGGGIHCITQQIPR